MTTEKRFLAFDLGAESGRALVGTLAGGRLALEEIHRFANAPVEACGTLYWDILALHSNVLKGIRTYVEKFGDSVDGIGIDTWGVDFGLFARDGSLLQNPVCYRDKRTNGIPEQVLMRVPADDLYRLSGLAMSQIQTLPQLFALRRNDSPLLDAADKFLMMPDILAYFLTGEKRCERTNAISTQLYDPRKGTWSKAIFKACDLPISIAPELIDPGTVLGEVSERIKRQTGLKHGRVIVPCTHDTASAVAAVPGEGDHWAFVSCGTWSVVGALSDDVITSPGAQAAGMANELTLKSFFLGRNIMGLWVLQQARAAWRKQGKEYSYEELVCLAEEAAESETILNVDAPGFLAPQDMLTAIREFCLKTRQRPPECVGAVARCIIESLALSYRHGIKQLAMLLGRRFNTLNIVGGGSQNRLLCQAAADATGVRVVAGPAEATAAGNTLVQALACGCLTSPEQIRRIVRNSSELTAYEPRDHGRWEERYARYLQQIGQEN